MIDRVSTSVISSHPRLASNDGLERSNKLEKETDFSNVQGNVKELAEEQNTKQRVAEVIESMNRFLQPTHTSLKFQLHEKLNEYYVSVVDDATQEIVREIPSKKLLDFYAAMTDFVGIMVDKKI
ncbi:flagellar protein FlaG [Peribacillus saganii]|uniref:Flagellar protein FlaG n=1 Tax=Peribacillus saganii TaxID=2303992 RepID=A0A372LPY3_9BACI|nr:flagellar protein FlaG [Peribacillus saganii]RFU69333.1 flagellar protein FlaG [Peribacillus saganii]